MEKENKRQHDREERRGRTQKERHGYRKPCNRKSSKQERERERERAERDTEEVTRDRKERKRENKYRGVERRDTGNYSNSKILGWLKDHEVVWVFIASSGE